MNIGYLRTDQSTDMNQRQKIVDGYAAVRKYKIDIFYSAESVDILKSQPLAFGDTLFVYDIACLGNKLKLIKDNIVWFTERGVSIFSAKEDYVFRPDTATKQLLDGVELALDMRKSMVSALTSKALDKVKRSGKKLGQKKGRRIRHLLDGKEDKIRSLLRQKISKAEIARQMGVSYLTLFNFVKQNQLESENG